LRVNTRDALAHSRYRPLAEPPFGLIGDSDVDDLGQFFTNVFDRVARGSKQIGERLRDRIARWFDRLV
ncbi:MAG: hypothetical protein ACREQL_09990, partial [Candidatus Binatia bacterium]